jgi:hypothetical protein
MSQTSATPVRFIRLASSTTPLGRITTSGRSRHQVRARWKTGLASRTATRRAARAVPRSHRFVFFFMAGSSGSIPLDGPFDNTDYCEAVGGFTWLGSGIEMSE